MKEGIRILGIDDSPFEKYRIGKGRKKHERAKKVLIVGAVYRQNIVEGILSTCVAQDGTDATSKLQKMISKSRFLSQIKLILMHGTMVAGLNVVDILQLSEKLKIPIIAVTKRKPDMKGVYNALKKANAKTFNRKRKIIERIVKYSGEFYKIKVNGNIYYIQTVKMNKNDAINILNKFGIEPLRLAHIVGSGIVKGESSGRL